MAPSAPAQVFTVEQVIGMYYGTYQHGWNAPLPPPASSYGFIDTLAIEVSPYDGFGHDYDIKAGDDLFRLNSDGTLAPYAYSSTFTGAFTATATGYHLEWNRYYLNNLSNYTSYSSFSGDRQ